MKAKNLLIILVLVVKLSNAQSIQINDILNDTLWASDTVKVYNDIVVNLGTTLTINSGVYVEFQGNYSLTVYGRIKAIGTQLDSITFTIHDTTSFSDTSTLAGGWGSIKLIDNLTDTSEFSYCNFSYGKAVDPGHNDFENYNENFMGGAIYADHYANLKCKNTTFLHNRAVQHGGGVWVKYFESLEFSNNLFRKNISFFNGGAIKIEYGTSAIIYGNRFTENITLRDGYTEWGHWVAGAGAGIYIGVNSNALVENNMFYNNSGVNGSLYETDFKCLIYNNIIANNMGTGLFSGITNSISSYINNTIVNNLSYDFMGGIVFFSLNIKMRNNIVYGNEGEWDYPETVQIYTPDPNKKADFSYGCNPDEPIYYQGIGNIHANPQFVNPTAGAGPDYDGMAADWSLLDSSPCINTGTPDTTGLNLPQYDIAGNPRIYGICVDMGACENQVVVGLPKNPLVNAKIEIVPNPFKDSFTIHLWGENKVKRIALINQSGINVKTLEHFPTEGLMMIDLNGFSSGLYLVVVDYEDGTRRIEKVLKE